MYVEVIVDIPSAQVNHPFDYAVPADLEDLVMLGSRVEVPFGNRKLMGFVVAIKETSDFAGDLKAILQVMDYQSFLNQELVDLSNYLADQLHAFRISILTAMLPSMLKAKYQAVFHIHDPEAVAETGLDLKERKIPRDLLESQIDRKTLKSLLNQGSLSLDYEVRDQVTTKKLRLISLAPDTDLDQVLESVSPRSYRQLQLIDYLRDHPLDQAVTISELSQRSGVNRSIIQKFIDQGWLVDQEATVYRRPSGLQAIQPSQAKKLRPSQAKAFKEIQDKIAESANQTFLLEGVTGSGKTEIYLQLIAQTLDQGKSAILLVPEIALTPQMVERVVGRFGKGVAVLHSGLSIGEKYDEWRRIIDQEAQVVVGARSSIFAPLENLGLIIIDEEHETTYKQSENPRYHARDVALWRSRYHQCPLILGSATPSLESRARAHVGRYQLIQLTERINQQPLPPISLVDMTQDLDDRPYEAFSPLLLAKIQEKLDRQEQVVLLLNRRGYAAYMLCQACGQVVYCPRCDISLTYHKKDQTLKCHYCNYQQAAPATCPNCHSPQLTTQGFGTQRIQETLNQVFPDAPVIRMDNDTTQAKGAHEKLLQSFSQQPGSILLGTQMIAKGLDFDQVTLVGVINADTSLNLPDFRSAERTFQLLTQVAGRTGRGNKQGEVVIQTYNPDHYVIQLAQHHDYEGFFFYEMQRRHLGQYPPYFYTTLVKVASKDRAQAQLTVYQVKADLQKKCQVSPDHLILLGPSNDGIERMNDYYHFQLLLKYKDPAQVQTALSEVLAKSQEVQRRGILIQIDHEPQYFI